MFRFQLRRLVISAGAPFELKPSPGKQWGAFATEPIKKGAIVLREEPLFVINKWHADIVEADIVDAFHRLSWDAKMTFFTVCMLDSVYHEEVKEAVLYNSFHTLGKRKASEFYVLRSRFNHSCLPNCDSPKNSEIFANRDIEAGEELFFSYGLNFINKTASERGQDMKVMGFAGDCSACVSGTKSQLLSDMRRRLARGLWVFIWGKDESNIGDPHPTPRPAIPDPRRRWVAEHHAMPTTSRMVFALLFPRISGVGGRIKPQTRCVDLLEHPDLHAVV